MTLRPSFVLCALFAAGAFAFACGGVADGNPGGVFNGSSGGGSSGAGSSSGAGGSSSGAASSSSGGAGSSSGAGGSSSGAASSSSSGGTGSSSGSLPPGCPATPPVGGSVCTGSASCQYGSDPDSACDTIAVCLEGYWTATFPQSGSFCPTTPPGQNGCPSAYPTTGDSCQTTVGCAYPQGLCVCTADIGPVVELDAGMIWQCEVPGTGCPEPRPAIGSACTHPNLQCDYGDCAFPGGPLPMTCSGGIWTAQPAACAE